MMRIAAAKSIPTVEHRESRRTGLRALYYKEFRDYFRSVRFLIVLVLIAVLGFICVYGASAGFQALIDNRKSTSGTSTQFMFLNLFILSGDKFISFATMMAWFGPIVGLALGFDAINGERSRRTLSRLVAQPIYRDAVINGKFLAGVTVITIMVFALGFIISGAGMVLIGLVPTLEELLRIVLFLLFTVVYISLFLAISLLLSLLFRHTATSALTGIGLWLFFVFLVSMLAGVVADGLFPVASDSSSAATVSNAQCEAVIGYLSPTTLYGTAASAILNPSLQSVASTISMSQVYQLYYSGLPGSLSFGQSLLLVWPHLTGLVALTMICFAISYVCFMKQEIRAE